ncbi:rhomboid family intramembrane serine protease [Rhodoferax saidenbachensis]|uniref:Rhomboid family GlyGly-CTERM serine protease n=1 Tax=Rhodoferax saidenbachensis TaxID=1484693 RepID=A0ABU1ZLM4_9BURK|nr:rhomboid family intramembrane serine protease [Rhodoferax saidenbachensis]MDR7306433.1 rhomboid family GlyGly-CTERM serine protease [Rhodoferax saidenbachensis]
MPNALRLGRVCWGGGFAAVTVVLQLWPGAAEWLRFHRPAFEEGAVWQLLTAQWVHLSLAHAVVNAMAAVLLCWSLAPWVPVRQQLLAWLGGHLGVAVVLALDSNCLYYAGASGALHGVLAGGALVLLCAPLAIPPSGWRVRLMGAVLLLALGAKLLLQPLFFATHTHGWLGIPTYYSAHAAGAAGGAVVVLSALLLCRWQAAQSQTRQRHE